MNIAMQETVREASYALPQRRFPYRLFLCVEARISLTKAVCVEVLSNDATTQSSTLAFSQSEDKLLHMHHMHNSKSISSLLLSLFLLFVMDGLPCFEFMSFH